MQITWNAFKPRRKTFPEDENRTVNVWLAKQEQEGTACWPVDNQHLLLTAKAMKLSFPGSTMSWLDSGAIDLVEVKLQWTSNWCTQTTDMCPTTNNETQARFWIRSGNKPRVWSDRATHANCKSMQGQVCFDGSALWNVQGCTCSYLSYNVVLLQSVPSAR